MVISTHNRTGYRRGCRCDECREDNNIRRREQRDRHRPERPGVPPQGTDHRWQDRAACSDVSNTVFFPVSANYAQAKLICAGCAVRLQCLAYALRTEQPEGVWGGLAPHERKRLFRRRAS